MKEKYQRLDIDNWPRAQQFAFYEKAHQPYYSICCDLDAQTLFHHCKAHNIAFSEAYLFLTMKTINQLEPFCCRLVDGEVRVYQEVMISPAILADDQTFRFCDVAYAKDFAGFVQNFKRVKDKALSEPFFSGTFNTKQALVGTAHMSVIPWISFTSFTHAVYSDQTQGVPRIVFGKMRKRDYSMPLAIDVHHALVDGLHVGQFVEMLQGFFDTPEVNIAS